MHPLLGTAFLVIAVFMTFASNNGWGWEHLGKNSASTALTIGIMTLVFLSLSMCSRMPL